MATIQSLSAKQIADSRGNPTIEVSMTTALGAGAASVPSGASVGAHEAKVVEAATAVAQINTEINVAMAGKEFDQRSLDDFLIALDGTPDRSRLGGNALLGISLAFARAAAAEQRVELYQYLGGLAGVASFAMPVPMFNVLNGGKHAKNSIDIQECMLVPTGIAGTGERVRAAQACVYELKRLLEQKGCSTEMGDEGGFAPALAHNDEALDLLVSAVTAASYNAAQVRLALDVAASSLPHMDNERMLAWYKIIAGKYPLVSIEDPFAEEEFDRFAALRTALGERVLIAGDDLTVTNSGRIALAAQKKAINAVIIKPNQVGTVSETIAAVAAARAQPARPDDPGRSGGGWVTIASHRSGETLDHWIADIAVGLGCGYIKAGAPTTPERMTKYARLIEIEKTLS